MVPATPTTVPASARCTPCSGSRSSASSIARVAASSSAAVGGSDGISRSVIRTEPMSSERAARTWPCPSPRMSSVEPPPMSTTRTGAGTSGSARVAPSYVSCASTSPLTTSGSTPRRWRTPAMKTSELDASRDAEVAQNRSASTRCASRIAAYSSTAAKVRSRASSARRPVRSTSWPSRTIRISRTSVDLVARRGVEVGDEQLDRVGAAVDRSDSGHASPSASAPASRPRRR